MLLEMLERGMQIDCILFCDTGFEFPQMCGHISKLEHKIGRPVTRIRAEHSYEYFVFDTPVKRTSDSSIVRQYGVGCSGYS